MKQNPFFKCKKNVFLTILIVGLYSCSNDVEPEIKLNENNSKVDESLINESLKKVNNLMGFEVNSKNSSKNLNFSTSKSLPSVWHLDKPQIIQTYLGLSIKGSGGGGSFIDGIDIINKIDKIDIYDISTVQNDKLYIVAGGIGAPTALKANLDALIESIESSVFTLANDLNKPVGGVLSVESGSANATIAMLLSKKMSIPLINADGAGRSVPELSNLSYAHESYSIAPTVLTSVPKPGDAAIVEVLHPKDADDAEKLIRAIISKPGFGQIAGLALWAQTGLQLKNSKIIKNTYSDAFELGAATEIAMYSNIKAIDNYFESESKLVAAYDGTLQSFEEKTQGGFDITTLKVGLSNNETITIKALNENLLLTSSTGSIVTAPNLISYLIEVRPKQYIPLNNGDAALMKSLVGKQIHIVCSYANGRLYQFGDTFLKTLKDVFGYDGPVIPPAPPE
ncbi:S-methyl thiohydantoin desulfurase domain-containing protein [Aestuariivivens insulae]|uniref:S-methyl thiohydantoin desulfurase domain-containing protein n=1 Tax=Aestuariivivens insulae TaxID=1621988 RepID=UPI001F5A06C4|nr:DUF917 family protein [Aestuariivivens insulae]